MPSEKLPDLFALDAKAGVRMWRIWSENLPHGGARNVILHGMKGGKMQETIKEVPTGKNIGRANETTPYEQALAEAKSQWQKRIDKGYSTNLEALDANAPPVWKPMKCQGYRNRKDKVRFPCYVQPKLNGCRILVENTDRRNILHSGGNKTYDVLNYHLDEHLGKLFPAGVFPDCEVYKHGWPLNKIVSRAKKWYPKGTPLLQLWVFDIIDPTRPFVERLKLINRLIPDKHPVIVKVPTHQVHDHQEIERWQQYYLDHGYEGTVIRHSDGMYRMKYRSPDVLKYPGMLRAEFKIIGVKEGKGLDKGCAIFECVTKEGNKFEVRPQGSVKTRQRYLKEFSKIKGKPLTVKHKEISPYGIPLCPTGEMIRDYE